jgi:hypothetical protein
MEAVSCSPPLLVLTQALQLCFCRTRRRYDVVLLVAHVIVAEY